MDKCTDSIGRKKLVNMLKSIPFEQFVFSNYFEKEASKRHNVTKEKLKEIYPQFGKIVEVTIRYSKEGNKYCFVYRMNKNLSYYLIFRLDRNPKELFNAYFYRGDVIKRIGKKYFGSFFKQ